MELDIWKKETKELELDLKLLKYPPCFCVLADDETTSKFLHCHIQTSEGQKLHITMLRNSSLKPTNAPLALESLSKCHMHVVLCILQTA